MASIGQREESFLRKSYFIVKEEEYKRDKREKFMASRESRVSIFRRQRRRRTFFDLNLHDISS